MFTVYRVKRGTTAFLNSIAILFNESLSYMYSTCLLTAASPICLVFSHNFLSNFRPRENGLTPRVGLHTSWKSRIFP